jgi:hypothetical protein
MLLVENAPGMSTFVGNALAVKMNSFKLSLAAPV